MGRGLWAPVALSITFLAGPASADVLDLTTAGSSGVINGAYFFQYTANLPTGTGVFGPFLRLQRNGTEAGYNTSGTLQFDTKAGIWTHAIQLSAIPVVNGYRQFALDINETASGTNPLLSLDMVQLFVTSNANITGYPFGGSATKVFDLDAPAGSSTADIWVKLNYSLSGSGSGRADMLMYVPDSAFTGTGNPYVVLYSKLGAQGGGLDASDGFEEWSSNDLSKILDTPRPPNIVPLPPAVWLLGAGLMGLLGIGRSRGREVG